MRNKFFPVFFLGACLMCGTGGSATKKIASPFAGAPGYVKMVKTEVGDGEIPEFQTPTQGENATRGTMWGFTVA